MDFRRLPLPGIFSHTFCLQFHTWETQDATMALLALLWAAVTMYKPLDSLARACPVQKERFSQMCMETQMECG